jgi:hypothetical protein
MCQRLGVPDPTVDPRSPPHPRGRGEIGSPPTTRIRGCSRSHLRQPLLVAGAFQRSSGPRPRRLAVPGIRCGLSLSAGWRGAHRDHHKRGSLTRESDVSMLVTFDLVPCSAKSTTSSRGRRSWRAGVPGSPACSSLPTPRPTNLYQCNMPRTRARQAPEKPNHASTRARSERPAMPSTVDEARAQLGPRRIPY